MKERWLAVRAAYMENPNKNCSLGGSLVAELSQADDRVRLGPYFPSPTKGSRIVSVSKDAFYTHREIDFVLGWPVIDVGDATKKYHKAGR